MRNADGATPPLTREMKIRRGRGAGLRAWRALCLVGVGAACGGGGSVDVTASAPVREPSVGRPDDLVRASCRPTRAAAAITPEGSAGSRVGLARASWGLLALVADQDARAIQIIDVTRRELVRAVPVGGVPEQLVVLDDGRVVVALVDRDRVLVLEASSEPVPDLVARCERVIAGGPYGLAVDPAGSTIAVTSTWAGALSLLDTQELSVLRVAATPRAPASVAIPGGDRAFVSHAVGAQLSVADLEGPVGAPVRVIDLALRAATPVGPPGTSSYRRGGAQGFALASVAPPTPTDGRERGRATGGPAPATAPATVAPLRIVVPMVSVDPGEPERVGDVYYGPPPTLGVGKHAPVGVVVDANSEKALTTHVLASATTAQKSQCYLPRGAVARAKTQRVYVACMGSDQLLELDARVADPMRAVLARYELPRGAAGLAISEGDGTLVAFGQFGRTVRIYELDRGGGADVELAPSGDPFAPERVGRDIFHRTDDDAIATDGLACASCHPEGRDDGLTWITREGPRQTVMLAGRVRGTAPYGWKRDEPTLEAYIEGTTKRLGRGLDRSAATAVSRYLLSLDGPRPTLAEGDHAEAGARVFAREGCATCHAGSLTTDNEVHDVGEGELDTPSLRYVGSTAPYFHDGRYPTIEAVLLATDHAMGPSGDLSESARRDLVAFLRSL